MSEGQYSLRKLFLIVTVIAVLLAAWVLVSHLAFEADHAAMRDAYINGRITSEQAIDLLGPDDPVFSKKPISD